MKVTDDATFPETGVVRFERVLDAPIDRVWQYLVDENLRKTWLGGGVIELVPGGEASIWYDRFGQNCVVSYELSPVGDATRLVLTHSRVATAELSTDVARGWHVHLDVLSSRLTGAPMPHLWERFDEMGEYYAAMNPA